MPTILAMTPFEKAKRAQQQQNHHQDQNRHQLHQSLLSSTKKKGQNGGGEDEVMFVKGQPYAILKVGKDKRDIFGDSQK